MQEKNYQTAKDFWTTRSGYPPYDHVEERRLEDIKYIAPRILHAKSLLDLGCGDGKISLILSHLTKISNFTLVDHSRGILDRRTISALTLSKFNFIPMDLSKVNKLLAVDAVICLGLFPYIFSNEDLSNLLESLNTKRLIVRTPCTLFDQDEVINTHSRALNAQYAAIYRTLKNTIEIIEKHFKVVEADRIYPDSIESKFGTKQFIFNCQEVL